LQGLKDRLAVSADPEADVLHQEVECLEQEIEELTNFRPPVCSKRSQNRVETRVWILHPAIDGSLSQAVGVRGEQLVSFHD
jgi:hypothetical protein